MENVFHSFSLNLNRLSRVKKNYRRLLLLAFGLGLFGPTPQALA